MGVEFQAGLGSHPHLNPPPQGGGSLILRPGSSNKLLITEP